MGNDVHGEWAAFALDGQIGWRIGIGIVLKASFCASSIGDPPTLSLDPDNRTIEASPAWPSQPCIKCC